MAVPNPGALLANYPVPLTSGVASFCTGSPIVEACSNANATIGAGYDPWTGDATVTKIPVPTGYTHLIPYCLAAEGVAPAVSHAITAFGRMPKARLQGDQDFPSLLEDSDLDPDQIWVPLSTFHGSLGSGLVALTCDLTNYIARDDTVLTASSSSSATSGFRIYTYKEPIFLAGCNEVQVAPVIAAGVEAQIMIQLVSLNR